MNIHDATEQAYKNGYNDAVYLMLAALKRRLHVVSPSVFEQIAKETLEGKGYGSYKKSE